MVSFKAFTSKLKFFIKLLIWYFLGVNVGDNICLIFVLRKMTGVKINFEDFIGDIFVLKEKCLSLK